MLLFGQKMTGIEFLGIVAAAAFHSYVKFFMDLEKLGIVEDYRVFRWYCCTCGNL